MRWVDRCPDQQNHYRWSALETQKWKQSYPGLDITAGVFPFFRRDGADATGAGVGGFSSGSATFCRFGRLEEEDGFGGSACSTGLGSRAETLRFLPVAGVRVAGVGGGAGTAGTEEPADSEELAACLAAARVILLLGGMSI